MRGAALTPTTHTSERKMRENRKKKAKRRGKIDAHLTGLHWAALLSCTSPRFASVSAGREMQHAQHAERAAEDWQIAHTHPFFGLFPSRRMKWAHSGKQQPEGWRDGENSASAVDMQPSRLPFANVEQLIEPSRIQRSTLYDDRRSVAHRVLAAAAATCQKEQGIGLVS